MAICPTCGKQVKRCKYCGWVGCWSNGKCSNSVTNSNGRCMKCGRIPRLEPQK